MEYKENQIMQILRWYKRFLFYLNYIHGQFFRYQQCKISEINYELPENNESFEYLARLSINL